MKASIVTTVPICQRWKRDMRSMESAPDKGVEMNVVNLYPSMRFQALEGFGASATDGAASTFLSMPETCQEAYLDAYFGEGGLGYAWARVPMDSCDASVAPYCAMPENDPSFRTFALKRDRETIMPFLRACEQRLGAPLKLMLSPWSPPAYMKTNGERNHGGKLRAEYADLWAEYLCRYVRAYRDAGFDVRALSVQNEPNAVQRWDSCTYTAGEERAFLMERLHPTLRKAGLDDVAVFIWDHNKERAFDRAVAILDGEARCMAAGVAFHWYSGDHFDAIRLLRERYPEKKLYFTEGCVEYSRYAREAAGEHARMYAHELLGDLNAGANAFIEWNYLVDGRGGPNHVNNWVEAPAMYHTDEARLELKSSYAYIWHVSHFVREGACRIGSTSYTGALEVAAFENPGGEIAAILLNSGAKPLDVNLRLNGSLWRFSLDAGVIATITTGI